MGRVYLAHHTDLHRRCALKVLSPRAAAHDVDYVSRFYHEGRAAAALIHPNVITTHAIGQDQGYHFLEMELVTGPSLQQLIGDQGRLTPVRATSLMAQVAEGLAAAHREKIVHRDLKPDNILLTHRGLPKIADFGLAKRVLWQDGLSAGHLVGTPNFMAPELFQGEPAAPASDIYALGVSYFVLLTGQFPYTGSSLGDLMHAAMNEPHPNVRRELPEIPLEMAECLSLLMAKSPANRPRDGIEAAQLLRAILGHVRDIDSLLHEAFLDDPNVSWRRGGQRYRLEINLADGRRQAVFVEPSDHGAADRLLLIYSICCRAQPEYYEYALRLNAEIAHGGLSIREVDGELRFCMVDTYPRGTVDPEEVRRSVLEVAMRADAIEQLLTGADRH
jgi:serine/threonine-protein kinase